MTDYSSSFGRPDLVDRPPPLDPEGRSTARVDESTQSLAGSDRLAWPDIARGIGIILVVLGHSIGGMMTSGQVDRSGLLARVFLFIYTFHMPLFFVLSGMFMPGRLARPTRELVGGMLTRIAYPYFFWGLLQTAAIMTMARFVNTPVPPDPSLFLRVLWEPPSQFWFLYSLALFQIAAMIFGRYASLSLMVWLALAVRIIPEFVELPKALDFSARYWIFYAAAAALASALRSGLVTRWISGTRFAGLVVAWAAAAYAVTYWGGGYLSVWDLPAATLGTLLVLSISQAARLPFQDVLAELGRRSMPIFVTHVLIVAGTRIAFTLILGVHNPLPILLAATIAGLGLPYLFYDWAERRGLASILALR
ncbi:acyltransferase family protein [Methylobacterium durans]|uniref:Acyltransferase 3 domain-containing protein n=1 Tax=Methylobacterium durans TaxID=2202825 RepID=A0A2U8W5N1_9HYPH|nr:acyltransferase [Methylobacterium durans]AWN41413.1 hypothetical protein DK389_13925 [Methylobacterium durans]